MRSKPIEPAPGMNEKREINWGFGESCGDAPGTAARMAALRHTCSAFRYGWVIHDAGSFGLVRPVGDRGLICCRKRASCHPARLSKTRPIPQTGPSNTSWRPNKNASEVKLLPIS